MVIKKGVRDWKGNLAIQAYEEIIRSIMDNEIKPGDLISENLIAENLGISRTPVREAIRMLGSEGIVESRDGVGTIVRMLSFKEMKDIFEVRKALEVIAIKTSINNIEEKEIDELLDKYIDISNRFHAGEAIEKEFSAADMQVHNLLVCKCDNNYVKELFASIGLKIQLYQHIQYLNFRSSSESIHQHMEILNLIKNRDLEGLITVLEQHIDWSLKWYLEALI